LRRSTRQAKGGGRREYLSFTLAAIVDRATPLASEDAIIRQK